MQCTKNNFSKFGKFLNVESFYITSNNTLIGQIAKISPPRTTIKQWNHFLKLKVYKL